MYTILLVQHSELVVVAPLVFILSTRMRTAKKLSLCHKLKYSNPYVFAVDISNLDYF